MVRPRSSLVASSQWACFADAIRNAGWVGGGSVLFWPPEAVLPTPGTGKKGPWYRSLVQEQGEKQEELHAVLRYAPCHPPAGPHQASF